MYVVATAGHVDHGKSALVRTLTGIEPDRWAEERRRGLTIDLGFAWTTLPSGADVAFVDVPGHERFLGNMLAGLGPAPVVMFVVAADEGWRRQSSDHRDAVAALGISSGVLVISRADRADAGRIARVVAQARDELGGTGLADASVVVTSALSGRGVDDLRATLDRVLGACPAAEPAAPVRLWIDRSFSVTGAGTVVTGTLSAGTVSRDDVLDLHTAHGIRPVRVRGLQSENSGRDSVGPVTRVAVNLRGVTAAEVVRGDALLTPGMWHTGDVVDLRRTAGPAFTEVPQRISVHVGTAVRQARVRPFGVDHARVLLDAPLPMVVGDRLVVRDPGSGLIGGGLVLDVEPPPLRRRGDAVRRRNVLADMATHRDPAAEVARRGAVSADHLRRLGVIDDASTPPPGIRVVGDLWVDATALRQWAVRLRDAVEESHRRDRLAAGLPRAEVADRLDLPADTLLAPVIEEAGVEDVDGMLSMPGRTRDLGDAEDAVSALEQRFATRPFAAPEADDLAALGLGAKELAAADHLGRLLRLGDVVLAPTAPAVAMRTLAGLDQPFTTSAARQALGTTRRVVIPLLEHLDSRGWTRRLDAGHREVVR